MPKVAWDFSRGIHDNEKCLGPDFSGAQILMCSAVSCFPPVGVVSSALVGLASGFGMGPGVSLPLWPP